MSGRISVLLATATLIVALAAVYYVMLGDKKDAIVIDAPPPASQPASQPLALRLTRVGGTLRVKPADGAEHELKVGDALSSSDEVVAGAGASAEIEGEGASIAIGAETQVQFRGEREGALQFFIVGGDVRAASSGRALELFGAGTTGRVRVQNAAARILSDGTRGLVTYSERGEVLVTNGGQSLVLAAGEATRLVAGKAPSKAWKLAPSALLKVAWPKEAELAVRKIKLSGTVSPGALVRVQVPGGAPQRALASESGEFVIDLKLEEGANDLVVQSNDLVGKHEIARRKVNVDTTPADVGLETSPDMWKKKSP
jgi:hypothetical protein